MHAFPMLKIKGFPIIVHHLFEIIKKQGFTIRCQVYKIIYNKNTTFLFIRKDNPLNSIAFSTKSLIALSSSSLCCRGNHLLKHWGWTTRFGLTFHLCVTAASEKIEGKFPLKLVFIFTRSKILTRNACTVHLKRELLHLLSKLFPEFGNRSS
jgi:hypothetical protein